MAKKITLKEYNAAAMGYYLLPRHRNGFPRLLARLLELPLALAETVARFMIPVAETEYSALVGKFPNVLPLALGVRVQKEVSAPLLTAAFMALSYFRPSTPVCGACGDLPLTIHGEAACCPNVACGKPISWELPSIYHRNWITCEDVVLTEYEWLGAPIAPKLIDQEIEKMGGLHSDIQAVLDRHHIKLPTLLEGLALDQKARMRYGDEMFEVVMSVTKKHFAAYNYAPADLEQAAEVGIRSQANGDNTASNPSVKKLLGDNGPLSVLLLYAADNAKEAAEFKLHLLPLLRAHHIVFYDGTSISCDEVKVSLIICLFSTYFFNNTVRKGSVIEQAEDRMSQWHLERKVVGVRLQNYMPPTEGFFSRIAAIPERPLSVVLNRDEKLAEVVEIIRQKLGLAKMPLCLEPDMIDAQLQKQAVVTLRDMSCHQFRRILDQVKEDPRPYPSHDPERFAALVARCVQKGSFINLRQAIEEEFLGSLR